VPIATTSSRGCGCCAVAERSRLATAAVIGCGVIGAGWAARLRLSGVDVRVYDPSPNAPSGLVDTHRQATLAWRDLEVAPTDDAVGSLTISPSIADACDGVELAIESVSERLDLKHATLTQIDSAAEPSTVIASSTSGFRPSVLAAPLAHPHRFVVAHPFNPVYLLPLVEVVAGERTDEAVVERALGFFRSIGMHPLRVRAEVDAHIADRLLEAMWREALWLVNDGVATTGEIDDVVRYGFGLRFAQMGVFETYRIAGGEGGMRQFISQFGEHLCSPWTRLVDVPELTDELIDTIAHQSDEQSGAYGPRELERIRDRNLVGILRALEANDWGAGTVTARMRAHVADGRDR
jgi:carnitine 3-dehydrogenase